MEGEFSERSPAKGQKAMVTTCSKRKFNQTYRKDLHNEGGKKLAQAAKRTCEISINLNNSMMLQYYSFLYPLRIYKILFL